MPLVHALFVLACALLLRKRVLQLDPERVYLSGVSMGGGGVWATAASHPTAFAAIGVMSHVARPNQLRRDTVRETWFQLPCADVAVQFFVRCGDLEGGHPVHDEARMHGDVVCVNVSARELRLQLKVCKDHEDLTKYLAWLRRACALSLRRVWKLRTVTYAAAHVCSARAWRGPRPATPATAGNDA